MGYKYFENSDDKELAALIKKDNQLAFAAIFDRYNKQLYLLAFRYLKRKEISEDAVQQVFVNFWNNRAKINENLNVKNLLFTSLKNHSLNILRDNKRQVEQNYEILLDSANIIDDKTETEHTQKMTDLIEKAVAGLSPQKKQIFYLKIIEGNSNKEIAKHLGISVNTVKVQYYHTLKEIKNYVGKYMVSSSVLISILFNQP